MLHIVVKVVESWRLIMEKPSGPNSEPEKAEKQPTHSTNDSCNEQKPAAANEEELDEELDELLDCKYWK